MDREQFRVRLDEFSTRLVMENSEDTDMWVSEFADLAEQARDTGDSLLANLASEGARRLQPLPNRSRL